jgi:hypothetical protein
MPNLKFNVGQNVFIKNDEGPDVAATIVQKHFQTKSYEVTYSSQDGRQHKVWKQEYQLVAPGEED